jgi:catechol 2,3-dioxygenase-like lactoylglutathione lyase family enzyme
MGGTTATGISQVATVIVPVTDQDRAARFFVDGLGFERVSDFEYGEGERWVEVAPPGAATRVSLVRPRDGRTAGIDAGVAFLSDDVERDHAELKARGVEVDDSIMREGHPVVYWTDAPLAGMPAMFRFRDPDGNSFLLVQA